MITESRGIHKKYLCVYAFKMHFILFAAFFSLFLQVISDLRQVPNEMWAEKEMPKGERESNGKPERQQHKT